MLLTVACQRELLNEEMTDGSDYSIVSFMVQPESLSNATRSDAEKRDGLVDYTQPYPHISDGTKADMLIYAVYDEDGELLSEFGLLERIEAGEDKVKIPENARLGENGKIYLPNGTELGEGQTYVSVKQFPVKIELRIKRGETYKVAFWAQSSKCDAYDVSKLTRVQVHYKEYKETGDSSDEQNATVTPNNDEMRDAFCKVETLKIEKKADETRTVYLYRPLAQINVGTTGYDYESVVRDSRLQYKYSRMQVATAARYLNVVTDEIEADESYENNSVFEFGYALIPAYTNYDESEVLADGFNLAAVDDPRQEFLKVHLYSKGKIEEDLKKDETEREYMPRRDGEYCDYADLNNDGKKTEIFKWLSMGYVLVNSETIHNESDRNTYKKTVLNSVRVWLATDKDGTGDEKEIVYVTNVDVTRNWRTNIVGDILTTDVKFQVVLDPVYAGDYNGFYENGEVDWSGPLNEDGGAWYDAEKDEILISSVSGLLWFQQMVNGSLVYTRNNKGLTGLKQTGSDGKNHTDISVGDFIQYYDEYGVSRSFGSPEKPYFMPIEDPTVVVERNKSDYQTNEAYQKALNAAKELKVRILRATHQDTNIGHNPDKKQTWPAYNNFHFVGTKQENGKTVLDPANVKLVADIDLSGIEWLGIGFDIRIGENCDLLGDNMYDRYIDPSNTAYSDGSFNEGGANVSKTDKKAHRGFFGKFDGNGHTVSNLKTKRFSTEVHPASWQNNNAGPYEAVQWFARGFFGQIGGTATVKNLTLRNVDIYGNHCVGGIVGAAVGVGAQYYETGGDKTREGKAISIVNCVVDGGKITNVPMYRGDVRRSNGEANRTFARGVNTGGIVGLYNASGSITGCQVRNLTINGYRITGGIAGAIETYYLAYSTNNYTSPQRFNKDNGGGISINIQSISDNEIHNTTILSDHFKPFDLMRREEYNFNYTPAGTTNKIPYTVNWAYGYAWNKTYSSFCNRLVGGESGEQYEKDFPNNDIYGSDAVIIDYACDLYPRESTTPTYRITDIENATVEQLPVLNNWFVDIVNIKSNLIGAPSAYKRYETHPFRIYSYSATDKVNVMWDLPNSYEIEWFDGRDDNHPYSGAVGMRVGAVTLTGVAADGTTDETRVLSVRDVTGEYDCAMQISSCDRSQFKGGSKDGNDPWFTSAETTVTNMIIRGNPYAYTGICLTPNECMSKITLSNLAVYDVYQTIALDRLEPNTGNVWPKNVSPTNVDLKVEKSNLRGYTVPGSGWKSIAYDTVVFEQGSHIPGVTNTETEYTCKVEATVTGTTFTNCTFKAPFIIEIVSGTQVIFGGETSFMGDCSIKYGEKVVTIPSGSYKNFSIDQNGNVTYE